METSVNCPACGTDRFVSKRTFIDLQTVECGKGATIYTCASPSGQPCRSTTWGITQDGQVVGMTVTPPGDPLPEHLEPILEKIEAAARALLSV